MQYFGGKNRLGKRLAEVINPFLEGREYIEPFLGSGGLLPYLHLEKCTKVYLSDSHPLLMEMWKALAKGWFPTDEWNPLIKEYYQDGETIYKQLMNNDTNYQYLFSPAFYGYFGFACSFGGKWKGGFARNKIKNNYFQSGL